MKVILLDDEKSMLIIMKKMLSKIKDIELVGSFQSPGEAYSYIKENKVDMAFVDINMREENGLDFVRRVTSQYKKIAIIFLTAYKEYALEAYGMHAFDYIVKPITFEKLENSIQKAKDTLIFLQPSNQNNKNKIFFTCLGSLEVKSAMGGSIQFTSSKSSELMAYLVMHKGRLVSKWKIMEDVFSGMAQSNAETYLNTTVYKLRKALEPHGMKSAIISAEEGYKIDLKEVYADIIDFEDRITSIYQLDESNLDEAIQTEKLYSGELFGEKDYNWSLPEKERISEVYFSFAKRLIHYLIDNMRLTVALHITKKINNFNELDEEINGLLMKIYSLQKNRNLLERQYERYKKILKSELGLLPDNTMVELYSILIKSFG